MSFPSTSKSPRLKRANLSTSSSFTTGSGYDDEEEHGDRQQHTNREISHNHEEWEGGNEVNAKRRKKKKDEPMSPVAVVCKSRFQKV